MQEEVYGVWHLYAFRSVVSTSGLCREHTLSWAAETPQLGFIRIRMAQIGVSFLSAVHSVHKLMDLLYFCSFSLMYLLLMLLFDAVSDSDAGQRWNFVKPSKQDPYSICLSL